MRDRERPGEQVEAANHLKSNPLGSTQLTLVRSKFDSPKLSSTHKLSARIDEIIPDLGQPDTTLRADYQIGVEAASSPPVLQQQSPSPASNNLQKGSVTIATLLDNS